MNQISTGIVILAALAAGCGGSTTTPAAPTSVTPTKIAPAHAAVDLTTDSPPSTTTTSSPSTTTTTTTTPPPTTAIATTSTVVDVASALVQENSNYIFDQGQLHTFELTLTNEALEQIDRNPAAEVWVVGSLGFKGETIDRVGIRYKGSVGAWYGCLSGEDWTNPSGNKTCTKLSMKVKINWDDSNREFHGLRRLQFHSMNLDPSQLHERLGYWLFREMGVPAPRSTHARLMVNGTYVGLFALTEQIDGRFTRYNFDDGTGNLYKEVWPTGSRKGVPDEREFRSALKTNAGENSSVEMLRTFGVEVTDAQLSGAPAVIKKWMDIDEVLAWAVVDRSIRNDDGPFHWYCSDGLCGNHNFYWYEDPTTGLLHLIPWDLDNAFENIREDQNPVTPIPDAWGEITNDCNVFNYGQWGIPQRSAACDPLFAAWGVFDDDYHRILGQFLDGPFAKDQVEKQITAWTAQIKEATTESADSHDDALPVVYWEWAIDNLLADLDYARDVAR